MFITEKAEMSHILFNTSGPEGSILHAYKATSHLLGAKVEIVRAIWLTPKESPTYRRLQQLAGTVSLLIGIVEPLAKGEPAPVQMQSVSAITRERAKECGVDLDRLNRGEARQQSEVAR